MAVATGTRGSLSNLPASSIKRQVFLRFVASSSAVIPALIEGSCKISKDFGGCSVEEDAIFVSVMWYIQKYWITSRYVSWQQTQRGILWCLVSDPIKGGSWITVLLISIAGLVLELLADCGTRAKDGEAKRSIAGVSVEARWSNLWYTHYSSLPTNSTDAQERVRHVQWWWIVSPPCFFVALHVVVVVCLDVLRHTVGARLETRESGNSD